MKTGASLSLTLQLPGKIYASGASSSPGTKPHPSNALPRTTMPWQALSAQPPLNKKCPCSLLTSLHPSHPDCNTWLESFCKEKSGIKLQDTYNKITLAEYRTLCAKGAPRAIPMMCALSIKKDEMLNPLHVKSRIVDLGNHEDHIWMKPEKYAPVLWPDMLRLLVSMAVERRCTLKHGDCKNAFCQGILPPDEVAIVKPPIGDPNAKKDEYWLLKRMLYGLCRSPYHWYTKIKGILLSLGLKDNTSDPRLFVGNLVNPSNPAIKPSLAPLTLGIYINDFVYFSKDPQVECQFKKLLTNLITVEFMGTVDWFLGTHFQWSLSPNNVSIHMNQTGLAAHLVEDNNVHT